MSRATEELRRLLEESRSAGFLGPGPVEPHLRHAEGFARVVEGALGREPAGFVDLGTGGGVPGLVLALRWPASGGAFVESGRRRCVWLRAALERLGAAARVEVLESRAEVVARSPEHRERFEAATARSFAGPAATAEIAAGLVAVGGALVVSEPPDADEARWPAAGLARLGFGPAEPVVAAQAHFVVVRKAAVAPESYPRAVGRPAKRPLW
jgi:16S rRNA (guanine527-N7)-methyltransferase